MVISVKIKYIPHEGCKAPETPLYATGLGRVRSARVHPAAANIKAAPARLGTSGLAVELPSPDYVALVFARSGRASSTASRSQTEWASSTATIGGDPGGLVNLSDESYTLSRGAYGAQLMVLRMPRGLRGLRPLGDTGRGEAGFGSTGK
jgi:dUTP pyrophosphatase